MYALYQFVSKHPKMLCAASLLIMLVLVIPCKNLYFDSSQETWLLDENETLREYRTFKQDFDWQPQLLVGLSELKPLSLNIEETKLELSERLKAIKHIKQVNLLPIQREGQHLINIDIIYGEEHLFADINKSVFADVKEAVANTIDENALSVHYSGIAINATFFNNWDYDRNLISPIFFALIILVLTYTFRTFAAVLMPLLVIAATSACSYGLLAWFGWHINALTSILVIIVIAASINDTVHVLKEFYAARNEGCDPRESAQVAFTQVFYPCLYTTLTTCAGFIALAFTQLAPVREFGVIAALTVCFAFLFTMFPVCSLLQFFHGTHQHSKNGDGWSQRFLTIARTGRIPILLMALILGVLSILYIPSVDVDSGVRNYFHEDSQMSHDLNYFAEHYGDDYRVQLVMNKKESLAEETKFVNQLRHELRQIDGVAGLDWLPLQHSDQMPLLAIERLASQGKYVSTDGSRMRMRLRMQASSDKEFIKVRQRVEEKLDVYSNRNPVLTGMDLLTAEMNTYIIQGLATSFSIAFVITSCFLLVFFRGTWFSCLAIVLCLWPIMSAVTLMPVLDIKLNLTTMLIAAITFCTVVDDSIHITSRYLDARRNSATGNESLLETFKHSGSAIWITTLILGIGFAVNVIGRHQPTVEFGILASSITFLALIADTILFAAILSFFKDKPQAN